MLPSVPHHLLCFVSLCIVQIEKLHGDVTKRGLGLVVFADWYHVDTMLGMRFFDDNTRSWWTPVTGGANVPALNDLLDPFGIAFGDSILSGPYTVGGKIRLLHVQYVL